MDVETLIVAAGGPAKLAKRLGVARTTVLDWRRSERIPGNRVAQIASEFKIPADDLLPIVQPPRAASAAPAPLPSEAA